MSYAFWHGTSFEENVLRERCMQLIPLSDPLSS